MTNDDITEIQQLMALYGHAVDAADQDMFPLIFTEDAAFDARSTGWGLIEGREAIAAWFALGKPPHPPAHNVMNVYIVERDGEVHALSKWMNVDRRSGGVFAGDNDDTVVRTPDGWRIKRRTFTIRYPEDYQPYKPDAQWEERVAE